MNAPIGVPERRRLSNGDKLYLGVGICAAFAAFELLIGASVTFAALMGLFMILTLATIQQFGGVATLFGLSMAAYAAQHIVVSQFLKAFAGQAPETRLDQPVTTMAVYCVCGLSFLGGAWLSKRLRFRRGKSFFKNELDPKVLARMAVAAAVFSWFRAAVGQAATTDGETATGGVFGLMNQMSNVDTMAAVCATASIVTSSNRRHFLGLLTGVAIVLPLVTGLVGGHRAAIIYPFFSIIVTAWAFGYRFRPYQAAWAALGALLFVFVISPAALAVRTTARTGDFGKDMRTSLQGLLEQTDKAGKGTRYSAPNMKYPQDVFWTLYLGSYDYESSTLTERFSLIKATDAMIDITRKEGTTEMTTITPGLLMTIPSYFLPEKPTIGTSNLLAHRIPGWVAANDWETQVTFGLPADVFSAYGWYGALIIPGLIIVIWSAVIQLFYSEKFKGNIYALSLAPSIVMYFAAGTIQSSIVSIAQVSYLQAIGFAIVQVIAMMSDTSYLHPRRRARRMEAIDGV